MYSHKVNIRVRYGETDKMGFVYYGVYAQYYEVGRVELLRSLGISYKSLEEFGYELPVVSFKINYKKPAFYDDEIIIKTSISNIPSSKIIFEYESFNTNGLLLNNGEVVLVFINRDTKKPCKAPQVVLEKLSNLL
jgi:acyl-CoA thioester hydrolase